MRGEILFFLTLSGLWSLSPCEADRQFFYVTEKMTWSKAQSYCRNNYHDLASLLNMEDNSNLLKNRELHMDRVNTARAWIGLYDDMRNWTCTLNSAGHHSDTHFTNWKTGELNNQRGNQICTMIDNEGYWSDWPCDKEFHSVCYNVYGLNMAACSSYLGIEYKRRLVTDDQLTASSVYSTSYPAYDARLDNGNSWFPATYDRLQWLQVDLKHPKTITGIITQGGGRQSYYVKSFKVSHSDDGRSWTIIKEANGSDKIFTGNHEENLFKENLFESPITRRFVRVLPWTWYNGIALRIELLGCGSAYFVQDTPRSWFEAQKYCRDEHMDLASVMDETENTEITKLLSGNTWMGLYRKPWAYWSEQLSVNFTHWDEGLPKNVRAIKKPLGCAAINTNTGKWGDLSCATKLPFVCQGEAEHHQARLKVKISSGADMNDLEVQRQLLQQVHAMLEKQGMSDFKLRWTQSDGNIFHKEEEEPKKKN